MHEKYGLKPLVEVKPITFSSPRRETEREGEITFQL